MTTRLIERWLPIAALGVESVRERTPMTPFPAPMLLRATVEWPVAHGNAVVAEFRRLARIWRRALEAPLSHLFPSSRSDAEVDATYLWARTVRCPHCAGRVPLSPNWRLAPDGTGVRLLPQTKAKDRLCAFEIVSKTTEQSAGTVAGGDGKCPFPDCERVIDGSEIKRQAQAGLMGEQLYCVVFKRRVSAPGKRLKSGMPGKDRVSWERGFRAPRPEDDNAEEMRAAAAAKMSDWEARGVVPTEAIGAISNYDRGHRLYGVRAWRDMFSPRQLQCHTTAVAAYQDLLATERAKGTFSETTTAAFGYLALSLDKVLDYNSMMTRWHVNRGVVVNTFDQHNFAFKWSYVEMAPLVAGLGFDWAIEQTAKCIEELVELACPAALVGNAETRPGDLSLFPSVAPPTVTVTCTSAEALDHVKDASVDAVVMDPPYGANVMYAELSDFFYVWLKRTAGHVYPELFRRGLTDKESEAVANLARFDGQRGAAALADRDYRERMSAIFAECRRVLKPDGVMTVMFTHKDTGAWDALTTGLMHAGFSVSASWPVPTEAEGSLHIKEKSAANSTIFLVCRPRPPSTGVGERQYWEDVEPLVQRAVRSRVQEFQGAGIRGVDLYLSCFGPALEEFSRHWPLRRGQPRPEPETKKRRAQLELFQEEWDPYAVTPEDALDAARREVKRWRLDQLTRAKLGQRTDLDSLTEWFVLAWDAFEAPAFPYDEALRLARVVGLDLDHDIVGRLAEKKGSDIVLWDSAVRAAKGALGSPDGSRSMLDSLHHAAHLSRTRTLEAARELLTRVGVQARPEFLTALTAILEVLPVSRAFTRIEEPAGPVAEAASDFEALENLRRLAFSDRVPSPKQLDLWKEPAGS